MATLGIFTVKIFHAYEGGHFTNGGFGRYLQAMCDSFDCVVMLCKVRHAPPPKGFYPVVYPNLEVVPVPALVTELGAIALQPLVFARGCHVARSADVIHARMPDWTGITGSVVARLVGKPCFHQIIGNAAGIARSIPLTKTCGLGAGLRAALLLYDWCERRVSRGQMVFAQGELAFEKHCQAAERHLVLSTAHSLADVGQVTPRCAGQRIRVLSVGRLQSVKNQQLLIRAIAKLATRNRRWELRILGEGAKRGALESLARELEVADRVAMPGGVPHGPLLWREYDEADLFALPSVSEGTPKVLLEAMARGCPVVASRVGGIPTAVRHEERGLLFESGDCDQLVAALERLAGQTGLRERCQHAALDFARLHTLEESTSFMLERVVARWPDLGPLRVKHA